MSKADRGRQPSAREQLSAQQQVQLDEARRKVIVFGGITLVVLIVAAILINALINKGTPKPSGGSSTGGVLPASVQSDIATVPASTFTAVGLGSADTAAIRKVTGSRLTSGGKPEMLYIGAEWCPYCAAMRWAMAVALSRFGTFSPLRGIHSSSTDVYPHTATLTFYKSTYTSKYLVFQPVENEDVNDNLLQQPTAAQQALWTKYDPPGDSYPFIDVGNAYIMGVSYDPGVLAGLSWSQIAAALHDPKSPVAKGAVGSANLLTAAICAITGNKPASVCTAPAVSSLAGKI